MIERSNNNIRAYNINETHTPNQDYHAMKHKQQTNGGLPVIAVLTGIDAGGSR